MRDQGGDRESKAIRANHRRALLACSTPGLVVGAVAAVVLAALGLALAAVAALVLITAALTAWLWFRATGLVVRSVGARPATQLDSPRLENVVDGLCATMGLSRPDIMVVESPVPNALALGRDPTTAVVVVTSGLEPSLSLVQLEGVLAHELVRIKRHDTVLAGVAVSVVATVASLMGPDAAADRVHALIGRGRAFSADQRAAEVVRYPPGIGSALEAMVERAPTDAPWPPPLGRVAALTRWLWVDPLVGHAGPVSMEGNLDDTRVRAASLALR